MVTYGKYVGRLKIILRQNNDGFFVLDVYNGITYQMLRLITDASEKSSFLNEAWTEDVEHLIDILLEHVKSGYHKNYWFLPFKQKIGDIEKIVGLVEKNYKKYIF